jgi:hypothetical protein
MCGIFVYRDELSMDASQYTFFLVYWVASVKLMKSVVFSMKEGRDFMIG